MRKPYIFDLPVISGTNGKLSFIEESSDSFLIKRVYWIYDSIAGVVGGNHAHLNTDRILICSMGKALIQLEDSKGEKYKFILDHPAKGLYFPKLHWITYELIERTILMVLTDALYEDDVKIADYADFKHHRQVERRFERSTRN